MTSTWSAPHTRAAMARSTANPLRRRCHRVRPLNAETSRPAVRASTPPREPVCTTAPPSSPTSGQNTNGRRSRRDAPAWRRPTAASTPADRIRALRLAFCPSIVSRSPPLQTRFAVSPIPAISKAAHSAHATTNVMSAARNTRRSRIRLPAAQQRSSSSPSWARSWRASCAYCCEPTSAAMTNTQSHPPNHSRAEGMRP